MRKFILIGVALVAALGTAFLISNWLKSQKRPVVVEQTIEAPSTGTSVLVADIDLPAGTIIQKDHLTWMSWPSDGVLDIHVVQNDSGPDVIEQDYVGAVVRRGIAQGEPITGRRVVRQGERGFLAAILSPGMRAVSVPVNAASGVSGLLFPGDRVDVLLTHAIAKDKKGAKKNRRASETVLRNVRLLAVDQTTNDQENTPSVAKTATLEVTPKQAEALTMLTDMGRLSLSLVSLAREDKGGLITVGLNEDSIKPEMVRSSFTLDNQVSVLLTPPPGKAKTKTIRVIRGNKVQSFSVGLNGQAVEQTPAPANRPPAKNPESEETDDDSDVALVRSAR